MPRNAQLQRHVATTRSLELKAERTLVAPCSVGVPFLGYRIFPDLIRHQGPRARRRRRLFRKREAACLRGELTAEQLTACARSMNGSRQSGQAPDRLSPVAAIRAFQETIRDYRVRPESHEENLWSRLQKALLDACDRSSSKTSRNYPRQKLRERIVSPKIAKATKLQINTTEELKEKKREIRLSA